MEVDANDALATRLQAYAATHPLEAGELRRVLDVIDGGRPWDRALPLHVTASALIVHRSTKRILLRWHDRQQAWIQVGGHADPGERDPLAVALREGAEETGLDDLMPWPSGALQHVAIVPVPANDREPAHEHADVRFLLATEQPDAARPEHGEAPLRWLKVADALVLTTEENVRETIRRAGRLLERPP